MAASADDKARVRRMTGASVSTYPDTELAKYIERYPVQDVNGNEPYLEPTVYYVVQAPLEVNLDWVPTYDLNAAAADILEELATAAVGNFDFAADGGSYQRSQVYENLMRQARAFRSRAVATSTEVKPSPTPDYPIGLEADDRPYPYPQ